jgi:hypothetical protein
MTTDAYKGLTNEEILMIYYRFKRYLDKLEENFKTGRISEPIDTPMGPGVAFKQIDSAYIEEFKQSENYIIAVSVVDKLKPIAEMIEEVPEMKELASKLR